MSNREVNRGGEGRGRGESEVWRSERFKNTGRQERTAEKRKIKLLSTKRQWRQNKKAGPRRYRYISYSHPSIPLSLPSGPVTATAPRHPAHLGKSVQVAIPHSQFRPVNSPESCPWATSGKAHSIPHPCLPYLFPLSYRRPDPSIQTKAKI